MAKATVHVGDVGTPIRLTIKDEKGAVVDVSAATTKEITIESPHGEAAVHPAAFTTDGTDGKIEYVTVAGDIHEAGTWSRQGYVVLPSGEWRTAVLPFDVEDNL